MHYWRRGKLLAYGIAVTAACGGTREPTPVAQAESGTVTVDGAALPYRIVGAGRPCLVFGSHLYYPRTFSSEFATMLRCVHVDQRGFLPPSTDTAAPEFTVDQAVADIERTRIALGLDRPILIGHSMHGTVALAYALAHPESVAGVVAIGAPPAFDSATFAAAAVYWDEFATDGRIAYDARNPLRVAPDSFAKLAPSEASIATYIGNGARYWADSSFDAAPLWAGMTVTPQTVGQLTNVARPYRLPETSAPGRPPVLLALGRMDFVVPPTLWDGRGQAFAQLTKRVFLRSGHTPQLEEAAAFDQALRAWLAQVPP